MNNQISARQLCVAGFTGLLSLFAAAWVDWRGALLAVPVVVLSMCAASSGAERAGGLLKNPGGRPLAVLYIVWGVLLAGTVLALCGERLSEAGAQSGPFWPTVLAALPVFWLAMGKPEAFARAAEILYLALAAVLAFVFLLGVKQVEGRWLLAAREGLGRSALTAAGLGCCGVYAVLLWNGQGKEEGRRWVGWTAAAGLVLSGMAALTAGSLSPALAGTVERPFFLMTVGLGETARVESLVGLLWLAADVTLLGLVLQACRGLWRDVLAFRGEKAVGIGLAVAALGTALCLEELGCPEEMLGDVVPLGGLILGGVVPVLLWGLGKRRKAPQEEAVSGGLGDSEQHEFGVVEGFEKKSKKSEKRC